MNAGIKTFLLVSSLVLAGCSSKQQTSTTTNDTSYDETNASHITLDDTIQITGNGLSLKDNTVTISSPGTYILEGTSSQAKIVVDSQSKGDVKLVCRNVALESETGPVITVSEASKTYIIVDENTTSTLSVSGSDSDEESGAILSHDDLVVAGSGTLNITSAADGIIANDTFFAQDITMNIEAGDDGIQVNDAIHITSSTLSITTNGGVQDTQSSAEFQPQQDPSMQERPAPPDQNTQDGLQQPPTLPNQADGTPPLDNTQPMQKEEDTEDESTKAKGIKCDGDIVVEDSTLTLNCADDAIHTNANFTTTSSTLSLQSGDDGIHADATVTINSGDITIGQSYEGIEGKDIVIQDGNIQVVSQDDGINASDPSVSSSMQADGSTLTIHGGNIVVDAGGDGIDMNGDGEMNGGTVTVYGPESDKDGAIDYNGTFNVNGGTLLAGGSSGMAMTPSQSSTVNCLMFDASGAITIQDADGNTILSYSSEKQYANLVLASDLLETGKTYTIVQDGEQIDTITVSAGITDLSSKTNRTIQNPEV